MNAMNPTTISSLSYKLFNSCNRDDELNRIRVDESANDFFGTEDLLSQIFEDAVHVKAAAD